MSIQTITDSITGKVGTDSGLKGTLKFVLDGPDPGVVYVDASSVPNKVSNEDKPADCTIKASSETVQGIINGDSNAMNAFMMGKIKVEGNMALAMGVTKIL